MMQIGDKVVCTRGPGAGQLQAHRIYTVQETLGAGRVQLVGLNVWPGQLWGAWRFEKVEDEES